jgi:hypothetical protein
MTTDFAEHPAGKQIAPSVEKSGRGVSIYRTILLTLLTLAAIAGAGLLGALTFYAVTDHRAAAAEAAEAKKTEVNKGDLATQVTSGVQNMYDANAAKNKYRIQFASDLTLFQLVKGGSEYRGLLTAKTEKGTEVPVLVTVYADGSGSLVYDIDSGSSLRLNQTASDELPKGCTSYYGC